jgi:hypothetical protein
MVLRNGEWAQIILARVDNSEWSDYRWFVIGETVHIDLREIGSDWMVIEVIIKANPPVRGGQIVKQYKVRLVGRDHLEVN